MRVTKALVSRMTALALVAMTLVALTSSTADAAVNPRRSRNAADALTERATSELDVFAGWLRKNKATGYIGEVGWPTDDARWNALAEQWYQHADAANLSVSSWVAGEWAYGSQLGGYGRNDLSIGSPLDSVRSNALIAESHSSTASALRGVSLTGPEMGSSSTEATSTFSNVNFGVLDHTYHYDGAGTYQYLANRGVRSVRMPFRWERVQRTLFGPLDHDEMARLATAVHAAHNAGLKVILDMHNFAAYYLHDAASGRGVRLSVGSAQLPVNALTDVWAKLSNYFRGDDAVYGFGLMNEPIGMQARGAVKPARVWELASQQIVNVIRATGDRRPLMVAGYDWSGIPGWVKNHPTSWIKDSARNFSYEAHQYFDARHSGVYGSYDDELAATIAQG